MFRVNDGFCSANAGLVSDRPDVKRKNSPRAKVRRVFKLGRNFVLTLWMVSKVGGPTTPLIVASS